jgi:hypothetical protein
MSSAEGIANNTTIKMYVRRNNVDSVRSGIDIRRAPIPECLISGKANNYDYLN